jgi:hypothetical protein
MSSGSASASQSRSPATPGHDERMDKMFDEDRHDEIQRELARDRQLARDRRRFQALAQACCPKDGHVLGTVYRMTDGCWLTHLCERLTREQSFREIVIMESMEHEAAVEIGIVSPGPWQPETPDEDHVDRIRRDWRSYMLVLLEDPLRLYDSLSLEQLCARLAGLPGNDFATCLRCKLTYVIDYTVMTWATGRALHLRSAKPVIVHPGRQVVVGPLDSGPAFGFSPSWRPGPWTILGQDTPAAMA